MRLSLLLFLSVLTVSCAHRSPAPSDQVPFDQRLAEFSSFHNARQTAELKTFFTRDATIQSPATPRSAGVAQFLTALAADPYALTFANTEIVYSLPGRAVTRSVGTVSVPGKYQLRETVSIDWQLEDGYWRIARLRFPDWPAIVGTWRRSGGSEGSMELRVLPGGTYLVYLNDRYDVPAFRGRYQLEANQITLADSSSDDPRNFQSAEGRYTFVRTGNGIILQKVDEQNTWRAERFAGDWSGR